MGVFNSLGRATHGVAGAQPLGKNESELGLDLDGGLRRLTQRAGSVCRLNLRRGGRTSGKRAKMKVNKVTSQNAPVPSSFFILHSDFLILHSSASPW